MAIDETLRKPVGFVYINDGGTTQRDPIGTFFLVTVPSDRFPDHLYGYAVTAAHVVMSEPNTELRILSASGELVQFGDPKWHTPYPDRDIAVAEYPGDIMPHDITAVPLERDSAAVRGWQPRLGSTVYYMGLLRVVDEMADEIVPMVRTGSVGTLNQKGVKVAEQPAQVAHLVDCRSHRGFSGSPCWMERQFVGPRNIQLPSTWTDGELNHETYGEITRVHALLGVFVGYEPETGVGVVLPVDQIHDVLDHEEIKHKRDKNDDAIARNNERGPFPETPASGESE